MEQVFGYFDYVEYEIYDGFFRVRYDDPRKIEELSKEECAEIIDCIAGQKEYCWTQWH